MEGRHTNHVIRRHDAPLAELDGTGQPPGGDHCAPHASDGAQFPVRPGISTLGLASQHACIKSRPYQSKTSGWGCTGNRSPGHSVHCNSHRGLHSGIGHRALPRYDSTINAADAADEPRNLGGVGWLRTPSVCARGHRSCSRSLCRCADRDVGDEQPRMAPLALEAAAEGAARLPHLKALMYEGPHGDCRAAFAALRAPNLQVLVTPLPTHVNPEPDVCAASRLPAHILAHSGLPLP